jgi:hypothetical protein
MLVHVFILALSAFGEAISERERVGGKQDITIKLYEERGEH